LGIFDGMYLSRSLFFLAAGALSQPAGTGGAGRISLGLGMIGVATAVVLAVEESEESLGARGKLEEAIG